MHMHMPGLHAHMDAGMNICTGHALRAALLAAHDGQGFLAFLTQLVHGAQTIPHGVEEMAWDLYLERAGWAQLLPLTHFSVHRSLLAGRDCDSPFSEIVAHSEAPHALAHRQTAPFKRPPWKCHSAPRTPASSGSGERRARSALHSQGGSHHRADSVRSPRLQW